MRVKLEPLFKTEEELCAAFIAWSNQQKGWTAYPETAAWDVLVVHADGTQIGVQAKLKFNMEVLCQAVEQGNGWGGQGPDFRAILVPDRLGNADLCDALGLTLLRPDRGYGSVDRVEFRPEFDPRYTRFGWHYRNPDKRCALPRFVPDVPAGVPSPSPLTKWKIAALQICAVMQLRGYVTRPDFRLAGIDHRRWVEQWLQPVPDQPGRWKWAKGFKGWAAQHPKVYPQVLAEVREKKLAAEPSLV